MESEPESRVGDFKMLFREDVSGNEILPTRPIIKPVENLMDSSPGLSEKIDRVRERRFSRRINPLFDEDLKIDFLLGLLNNRVQNRENLRSIVRSSK